MKRKMIASLTILFAIFLIVGTVFGEGNAPLPLETNGCGSASIRLNELDYEQPSTDNREFIELLGDDNAALDGYEIHLLDGDDASIYRTISLDGQSLASNGYLVIGNLQAEAGMKLLAVSQDDFLQNDAPNGVGVYDINSAAYCDFINYEGTVSGFDTWRNIGEDRGADGVGRSCARKEYGSWSCFEKSTPGHANGTVAVQVSEIRAVSAETHLFILLFATGVVATTTVIRIATIKRDTIR